MNMLIRFAMVAAACSKYAASILGGRPTTSRCSKQRCGNERAVSVLALLRAHSRYGLCACGVCTSVHLHSPTHQHSHSTNVQPTTPWLETNSRGQRGWGALHDPAVRGLRQNQGVHDNIVCVLCDSMYSSIPWQSSPTQIPSTPQVVPIA